MHTSRQSSRQRRKYIDGEINDCCVLLSVQLLNQGVRYLGHLLLLQWRLIRTKHLDRQDATPTHVQRHAVPDHTPRDKNDRYLRHGLEHHIRVLTNNPLSHTKRQS